MGLFPGTVWEQTRVTSVSPLVGGQVCSWVLLSAVRNLRLPDAYGKKKKNPLFEMELKVLRMPDLSYFESVPQDR